MATYTDNYNLTKPTFAESADIRTINGNMDKIDEVMHSSQVSIAEAYSNLETYKVGDMRMYEKLLYECITPIDTPETWDPTKWKRAVAVDAKPDVMTGATATEDGESGLVPAPSTTDKDKYLKGDGSWATPPGGGTTVIPNPQGTPTDTLSTIGIGDTIFDIAGGGGLFIDTNNVIQAFTPIQDTQEHTYTATEDCAIAYTIAVSANSETFIKVDNAIIGGLYATDTTAINDVVYIKKGQTFSFQQTFTNSPNTGYTVYGIKYGSSGSGGLSSEIIPITAGDDTTTRTFTFDKTPQFIKFYWQDATLDGGWATDGDMLWGQSYMNYRSKRMGATVANVDGGISTITYGADNKSITITGGNAFGALNSINGSGYMFIDYGSSGGSGGSEDISDMTWTLLTSTSGTGSATAIPSDTKYLVVAVKDTNNGKVTIAAKESISAINKVLDVLGETTYILHGYWKDQSGNDYGDASAQISNGYVTAYSSYNTLTTYVYALS